jgi:hypothetical protein
MVRKMIFPSENADTQLLFADGDPMMNSLFSYEKCVVTSRITDHTREKLF